MILLLHKVSPEAPDNNENWNTPAQLEMFIEKHRRQIVSLRDYVINDFKGAVISFDGVYENVFEHAWPVLRKHDVPFELFVTWGCMGEGNEWDAKEPFARFASLEQIWAMCSAGKGRVQSHSVSHPDLTSVGDEAMRWELGNPFGCEFFAYPYGRCDARVIAAVKAAGFKGGIGVRESAKDDRWRMPREFLR